MPPCKLPVVEENVADMLGHGGDNETGFPLAAHGCEVATGSSRSIISREARPVVFNYSFTTYVNIIPVHLLFSSDPRRTVVLRRPRQHIYIAVLARCVSSNPAPSRHTYNKSHTCFLAVH